MSSFEKILKSLGLDGVPLLKNQRNDDTTDRLSHRMTVALLVMFAFTLTTKQFVGEPIYCWTPAHFMKDSHDDYTNK
jgi:innexin